LEKDVQGEAEVIGLVPAGEGEESVAHDLGHANAGPGRQRWDRSLGDGRAVGPEELETLRADAPHIKAAFVNRPVVPGAQQDEVLEDGRPALGPVDDMVGMDEAAAAAAREAAAAVPGP
jgi:hypothetical protein